MAAVRLADRYLATHTYLVPSIALVCICKHPWLAGNPAFFGTSWEQRWWPRHYRNTARLAVSSLARNRRLYVARHEVVVVVIVIAAVLYSWMGELAMARDAAPPRCPRLPSSLLGPVDESVDARSVFLNVCFTFALLLCPPRADAGSRLAF